MAFKNKRQARKASSKHLVVKLEMVAFPTQEEIMEMCHSGAALLSPLQQAQRELPSSCLSNFIYGDNSAHFCPPPQTGPAHPLLGHACNLPRGTPCSQPSAEMCLHTMPGLSPLRAGDQSVRHWAP